MKLNHITRASIIVVAMLAIFANTSHAATNQQIINEAKLAVKERLKDPESARFRNVRVEENPNKSVWIKGEYNAKNSYGGYVGFEKFVYSPNDKHLVLEPELRIKAEREPLKPSGEMGVDKFIYYNFFIKDW